jgi:hypothetical protein
LSPSHRRCRFYFVETPFRPSPKTFRTKFYPEANPTTFEFTATTPAL